MAAVAGRYASARLFAVERPHWRRCFLEIARAASLTLPASCSLSFFSSIAASHLLAAVVWFPGSARLSAFSVHCRAAHSPLITRSLHSGGPRSTLGVVDVPGLLVCSPNTSPVDPAHCTLFSSRDTTSPLLVCAIYLSRAPSCVAMVRVMVSDGCLGSADANALAMYNRVPSHPSPQPLPAASELYAHSCAFRCVSRWWLRFDVSL